jgi:TolB-like protein
MSLVSESVFCFEDCTLDLRHGVFRRGDRAIDLRPKSFEVLRYLVENAGRLVSKDELIEAIWPNVNVADGSLARCVSDVRQALDDDAQRFIKTVPRRGYRFDAAVSLLADKPKQPTPALPHKPSIAVLPFLNMTGDSEQDYFADGIVEEIITALSRMHWLFVIASNSSFIYKGRAVDMMQVGRELGARYVLEGGVRRTANRVRITAQLIDASTGAHLWADRFEAALDDIFDLQDKVTANVVGAIAPELQRAEIQRAKHKPTESLDAYDHYLRAIASLRRAHRESNRQANEEALRLSYRAIELDPDYSSAYGLAAQCYITHSLNGWMTDRVKEIAEAQRLARRAVELGYDDELALCHAGLALAYLCHDLEVGAALLERALALNSNLQQAWLYSGWVKIYLGDVEPAIERLKRSHSHSPRDPLIYITYNGISYAHFYAGRYDDAATWAEKALAEAPHHASALLMLAAAHALAGRLKEAHRAAARIRQLDASYRISDVKNRSPLRRPDFTAKYEEGLRKAGLPE